MAITLTYLYLSFIGLTYQYFHLKSFDVSLFDFSNTNDYLLAFLKSVPFLLVLVILHFLLLVKDMLFNERLVPRGSFKERCKKLLWSSLAPLTRLRVHSITRHHAPPTKWQISLIAAAPSKLGCPVHACTAVSKKPLIIASANPKISSC